MKKILPVLFCILIFLSHSPSKISASENTWSFSALISSSVGTIKKSPVNESLFFLHTNKSAGQKRILASYDKGESWQDITGNLPDGSDINSIAPHPTDENTLYVGMYSKGIYKTTDGGQTWLSAGLQNQNIKIRALTIDPQDGSVLFAGTGLTNQDGGVYKTSNQGETWDLKSQGMGQPNVLEIKIAPSNHNLIFASGGYDLWKSTDIGESWQSCSLNYSYVGENAIAINPINPEIIYAGQWGHGLYKTIDGGETWTKKSIGIENKNIHNININPNNTNEIYITTRHPGYGVFKSLDASESWSSFSENLPSLETAGFAISLSNNKLYVGVLEEGIWERNLDPLPTRKPVVLLPGHGGCWSTQGLLHNDPNAEWHITPFVKVYENLKNTFLNNGYQEGKDFFVYCYDWRKRPDELADSLKNFIDDILINKPNEKVQLIGHSMGGLVSRVYLQKFSDAKGKIDKLVTAGTPHAGVLKSYYGWEAGEIDDHWSWPSLAVNLFLRAKSDLFQTKVEAVREQTPSTQSLIPTFDFLKNNSDKSIIPSASLSARNTWLENLNNNLSNDLKTLLITIYGLENEVKDSAEYYLLEERGWLDKLLGRWKDGRLVNTEYTTQGDLTILSKSASISDVSSAPAVPENHQGIIESELGITTILESLGLDELPISTDIQSPERNPSLVFWLRSPATLKVTTPGSEVKEAGDKGLLVIPQADNGSYNIELKEKNGGGEYHLTIGQLSEDGDVWDEISGIIQSGETLNLSMSFNGDAPEEQSFVDENGDWFLKKAKEKNEQTQSWWNNSSVSLPVKRRTNFYLNRSLHFINKATQQNNNQKHWRTCSFTRLAMVYLFRTRIVTNNYFKRGLIETNNQNLIKNYTQAILDLLTKAYETNFNLSGKNLNLVRLQRDLDNAESMKNQLEVKLSSLAEKGENQNAAAIYLWQERLLENAKQAKLNDKLSLSQIQAWTSRMAGLELKYLVR